MIIDTLENIKTYTQLHPRFAKAFTFLEQDLNKLENGKYDIDGKNIFAMVSHDTGKTRTEGRLETHEKYIDIQVVLEGVDDMGWRPKNLCISKDTEYDEERDLQFFKDTPETWLGVGPRMFAIFFPEDGHMPLIANGTLRKIVVKVAL